MFSFALSIVTGMSVIAVHVFLTRASIGIGMLAGIFTVVGVGWSIGTKINKAMRRQDKIDSAISNMDSAMKEMKTLQGQLTEMSTQLLRHTSESDALLKKELRANDGSSIKDQVIETAKKALRAEQERGDLKREVSGITRDVAHVQATLNEHIDDGQRHVRAHDHDPQAHQREGDGNPS